MLVVICALIYLRVVSAVDPDVYSINYVQDLKDIEEARKLLDLHLVNKEYSAFDPDLQYLAMMGVVQKTAKGLIKTRNAPVNSTQLLLHYLQNYLPKVWLKPIKVVKKLERLRDLIVTRLQPLALYVKYVCGYLEDSDCNKMADGQMQEDPEIQNSTRALLLASDVARALLVKDPELVEAANSLNILPYILSNLMEVVEFVELVAKLMKEVDPYRYF